MILAVTKIQTFDNPECAKDMDRFCDTFDDDPEKNVPFLKFIYTGCSIWNIYSTINY